MLNSSSLLKQRRQQFKKSLQTFGPSCFVRALVDVLIKNDNKIEVQGTKLLKILSMICLEKLGDGLSFDGNSVLYLLRHAFIIYAQPSITKQRLYIIVILLNTYLCTKEIVTSKTPLKTNIIDSCFESGSTGMDYGCLVRKSPLLHGRKIHSHSQIFRYGQSIFCLPHWPKFSDFFDLCLHRVSVVCGYIVYATILA